MSTPKNKPPQIDSRGFLKYIGLAFQMGTIIALGTYLGYKVDRKTDMAFPLYLLLGCFLSIAIAFYQLFKSLKSDDT